jgi:hypothetical protein
VATALIAMGTKGKNPAPERRETSELNIEPSASKPGTFHLTSYFDSSLTSMGYAYIFLY